MLRIIHMASMARSGETMVLRAFAAHPRVVVAGQLTNAKQGDKRLLFFKRWPHTTIPVDHPQSREMGLKEEDIVLVKQGIWQHEWPFEGFVLTRNPLSVYRSLKYYDGPVLRLINSILHALILDSVVRHIRGNIRRLYRWSGWMDVSLQKLFPKMSFLEMFCAFYNQRMQHLMSLDLPVFYYESIVENPRKEFTKLCGKIGLPFDEAMLNAHQKFSDHIGHGNNDLSRPITNDASRKVAQLTEEERKDIIDRTRVTWEKLGYRYDEKTHTLSV